MSKKMFEIRGVRYRTCTWTFQIPRRFHNMIQHNDDNLKLLIIIINYSTASYFSAHVSKIDIGHS